GQGHGHVYLQGLVYFHKHENARCAEQVSKAKAEPETAGNVGALLKKQGGAELHAPEQKQPDDEHKLALPRRLVIKTIYHAAASRRHTSLLNFHYISLEIIKLSVRGTPYLDEAKVASA